VKTEPKFRGKSVETDEEDYRVVVVNACETEEDALGGHSKITDMTEEELLLLKEI